MGIITGIKICKAAPSISHLLFVNDCMIFCKANMSEAHNIMELLQIFGSTSGQLINFNKSGVFFSKNTNPNLISQTSSSTGVQILQLDDKYLGSPLFTHRSKIIFFKPGVEKLKLRLSGWKNTPLNPAGREFLIKSVTSSACIYQMNCFKVPKKTCKDINKLQRDFFWGKNIENPTGYYPKAWTSVCKPIELGGLRFMNMELFNSSMITKIGWRLEQDKYPLWYKLMDAKYLLGRNVLNMDTKSKDDGNWDETQVYTYFNNDNAAALYKAKFGNLYRNDIITGNWEAIWNMEVAPVIRIFIWKCAHGILPTNAKTASILYYINPTCIVCNSGEEETMTHMFLNCSAATVVLHEIIGSYNTQFYHFHRLAEFLVSNWNDQ
ncbi:uncharacterized protein LOC113338531 [Papaver somniferum]|uniref:uncharacterized protein LOC113338531 n=1 Tax=Papaver somniferum TaxID=3469 RepID=UPI000E6FE2D3|nr:uncharacterized protein LOC113338531 [Papaver somniferum]